MWQQAALTIVADPQSGATSPLRPAPTTSSPSDLSWDATLGLVEFTSSARGSPSNETRPHEKIGQVDALALTRRFDRQATPALFAEGPQPSQKGRRQLRRSSSDWPATTPGRPEDPWLLTLFWEAIQAPPANYYVFTHIEGGFGGTGPAGVWGQSDGVPACGERPTGTRSPGDKIVNRHLISPAPERSSR